MTNVPRPPGVETLDRWSDAYLRLMQMNDNATLADLMAEYSGRGSAKRLVNNVIPLLLLREKAYSYVRRQRDLIQSSEMPTQFRAQRAAGRTLGADPVGMSSTSLIDQTREKVISEYESDIYHASHANAHNKIDQSTITGMTRRSESQVVRLREAAGLSRQIALTREERELQQAARGAFVKNLGIAASEVSRLRAARRERLREVVPIRDLQHEPYPFPTQEDRHDGPDSLGMWWAQTNAWGNAPGIALSWQDDGMHFSGRVHVSSDDLHKYSVTILAQFALGGNRIPDSARGMVKSAPTANVFGFINALALDWSLFHAFDDQWAKCWLNIRQSVWVHIPGLNIGPGGNLYPWGSNADSRNLISVDGLGIDWCYLQGRIAMPPVEFNLLPQITGVEIDLEFSFDMQLEGDNSTLIFGHDRDWPSNVVETPQWKLISGA